MIKCKIINLSGRDIALDWIRGGISIPADSAAILEYDPFTLMDHNSSIYMGALGLIKAGVVAIEYCAVAPATMAASFEERSDMFAEKPREPKERPNVLFREKEPYHKNEFNANVPEHTKPAVKREESTSFNIAVPKDAPKAAAPVEAAPAAEPAAAAEPAQATAEATAVEATAPAVEAKPAGKKKSGGTKKL